MYVNETGQSHADGTPGRGQTASARVLLTAGRIAAKKCLQRSSNARFPSFQTGLMTQNDQVWVNAQKPDVSSSSSKLHSQAVIT